MNDEERIELEGLQACQWWLVPPQLDNAGCETVTLEKVLQRDGPLADAFLAVLEHEARGTWRFPQLGVPNESETEFAGHAQGGARVH